MCITLSLDKVDHLCIMQFVTVCVGGGVGCVCVGGGGGVRVLRLTNS